MMVMMPQHFHFCTILALDQCSPSETPTTISSTTATATATIATTTTISMEPIISLLCFIYIATECYLASTANSYINKNRPRRRNRTPRVTTSDTKSSSSKDDTELANIQQQQPTMVATDDDDEDEFLNQVGYLPPIPEVQDDNEDEVG
jgi:hypothetical protein